MLSSMTRRRILVVDDSEIVLRLVENALAEWYDVDTAADGVAGLEQARRHPPDLIITDSLMPGLDGFGLLRKLKDDQATASIPAIVLTSEEPHERTPGPGDIHPSAIVTKSMDMAPLLAAVKSALAGGSIAPA
jgi:CheY-like chemotaxis protein